METMNLITTKPLRVVAVVVLLIAALAAKNEIFHFQWNVTLCIGLALAVASR
jgi:hypothetical protein